MAGPNMGLPKGWAHFWARVHQVRRHSGYRMARLRTLRRLAVWRVRCWLGAAAEIELPPWNARFFLPPRWGGEGTTMIFAVRENYENELRHLDRFVAPGSVVVDAGANLGIYTVVAGKLAGGSGRVLAFEPGRRVREVLQRNVKLNGLENVHIYPHALSDHDGTARLYHHGGPVGYSIAPEDDHGEAFEEVETITLDTALAREGLERVDFVKIDIEGAEQLAFDGAKQMFRNGHPVVVFEINPSAATRFGTAPIAAWRHLEGLGYGFFELNAGGVLCPLDAPPPEDRWEFINIVAIHPDDQPRFAG